MRKIAITVIIMVILSGFLILQRTKAAGDSKYMLTERYGRPFCDVNKTNKNDGKMCWAASISNMTGFSFKYDPELTFNYFKSNYDNSPKSIYDEFFSLFKSMSLDKENILFLISFDSKKTNKRMDLCIVGNLLIGRVVNIGVDKELSSKIGHALTVYGFEVENRKLYIFYVDSNDGIRKLYREKIESKKGITRFTTGKYRNRIVDTVVGLQIFE